MNIAQAKQLRMKDLLAVLGCQPHHETKGEIWYPSPFRHESEPSFKINLDRKIWYDFGEGEGGNILDLAMKNIMQPICEGRYASFLRSISAPCCNRSRHQCRCQGEVGYELRNPCAKGMYEDKGYYADEERK